MERRCGGEGQGPWGGGGGGVEMEDLNKQHTPHTHYTLCWFG